MEFYTFPSQGDLRKAESIALDYMRPNNLPFVAVCESYLTEKECQRILADASKIEPHSFPNCEATSTRDYGPMVNGIMGQIAYVGRQANRAFWGYDLDAQYAAYVQTYKTGASYMMHMDAAPGQNRKLTALAILSDPEDYRGGTLRFWVPDKWFVPPLPQGTVLVFPFYILHEVRPVSWGTRRSVNVGFWGPPFK